jgi:outer membrane protein OmpA-like peptidoglycan-associated protein
MIIFENYWKTKQTTMRNFKPVLLLLLIFTPFLSFSQYTDDELTKLIDSGNEGKMVQVCSELMSEGFYFQAAKICDKLLQMKPNSANYNYRRGFIYLEMSQDFGSAIPHLEKAVTDLDKNWDAFSPNEESAPLDALYFMGKAYHMGMDINKAENFYTRFVNESKNTSEYIFFSKLFLQQCAVARKEIDIPRDVTLKNVGYMINSSNPEYSPVVSLDGTALYFTSRRLWDDDQSKEWIDPRNNMPTEDVYVSFKDFDGEWMEPYKMEFCKVDQNEATVAVSSDERRIYLYEDTKGNGDLFYSDFSTNKFQDVQHYEAKKVNTDAWETHCTVTPDGQNMYFVSDRKGGYGGRDIYRVVKLPDGSWSDPQNCGPKINSAMDEDSPFIAIDNKTLYFSSNGPTSMGGFDVFVTVRDSNNEWSDPINLGYPLNSTVDDLFYTTTVDGLTGYLTSARSGGKGEKDIYEVQNDYLRNKNLAVLKGKITTLHGATLPEDISITVKCTNCGDKLERKVFPRMRDGVFFSALEPCREYEMVFSYDNGKKEFYKEAFSTDCNKEYDEIEREVFLDVENQEIFKPYYIVGTVKDSKSKKLLSDVSVKLINKETGKPYVESTTASAGNYKSDTIVDLKQGTTLNAQLVLEKAGYVSMTYDLAIPLGSKNEINIDELIDPIIAAVSVGDDLGTLLNLNPIYFDYNKWDIRPDAAIELDKIVKAMKLNPELKIELGSHTDSRGNDAYNLSLSDKRAKASAAYIISKGISASRIKGKGYGETKLKVSDAEIKAIPKWDDQEKAHQLNRRTEFIVVK